MEELAVLVLKVATGAGAFVLLSIGMAFYQSGRKSSKGGDSNVSRKFKM